MPSLLHYRGLTICSIVNPNPFKHDTAHSTKNGTEHVFIGLAYKGMSALPLRKDSPH